MDTNNTTQIDNHDVSQNEKVKTKIIALIILFAIVFSFVVNDGVRLVIQKFLEIPSDAIGLAQWGDTFFLRIFASLLAMAAGTFVIGTFLKTRARLAGVVATLPATIFWIAILIFGQPLSEITSILLKLLRQCCFCPLFWRFYCR
jgi:hypothetical protein